MLDEPFWEASGRDSLSYRLLDGVLYFLGAICWLALFLVGLVAVLFEGSKVQVDSEWER